MKKSHEKVSVGAFHVEKKLHVEGSGGITHLYVINNWIQSSDITMYILSQGHSQLLDYM